MIWQVRYHILLKISHIYLSYSQKPKVLLFILAKISKFLKKYDILYNDLHSSEPQFFYALLYVYNWQASNTCLVWFNQLNTIVVPYIFKNFIFSVFWTRNTFPQLYFLSQKYFPSIFLCKQHLKTNYFGKPSACLSQMLDQMHSHKFSFSYYTCNVFIIVIYTIYFMVVKCQWILFSRLNAFPIFSRFVTVLLLRKYAIVNEFILVNKNIILLFYIIW